MMSEKQLADFLNKAIRRKINSIDNSTLASEEMIYKVGVIYGLYRVVVSIFLIFTNIYSDNLYSNIVLYTNIFSADLEHKIVMLYLCFSIISLCVLYFYKQKIDKQLLIGFYIDVIALTMLMYSGIAKDLQISLLFMVVSASSFMLLKARNAIGITMLAVLSLLFQQVLYAINKTTGFLGLTDAILLSFSLIAVGFVSWSISQRIAFAERKEWQKSKENEQLRNINEQVIKNILSGVIVFNDANQISLINTAAVKMLRLNFSPNESELSKKFVVLNHIAKFDKDFIDWYQSKGAGIVYFLKVPQGKDEPELTLKVTKRELSDYGKMLVLEDESHAESQAQKLKLQSLAQLSASIAHEIKNPLSSIGQASQLLQEMTDKQNPTYELVEIIDTQTKRVARIIDDIVRLSRQEPPSQDLIHLKTWLPNFIRQYYAKKSIGLYFRTDNSVMFDPNHLEQIITNLLNNALRHTKIIENTPSVQVLIHANKNYVCIDVMDHGDGVPKDDVPNLFKPFFSKSEGGTGLGLYLCKAFSEANHARLMYLPEHKKSCFRLIMPIEKDYLE